MKTILVDAYHVLVTEHGIDRLLHALLEQYDNPKIAVTNADDEEQKTYGLDAIPYELFTRKHDPGKADPDYYEELLDHYGLDAEDVVAFEHDIKAVSSAESVGITTHHFDADERNYAALKIFLDEHA